MERINNSYIEYSNLNKLLGFILLFIRYIVYTRTRYIPMNCIKLKDNKESNFFQETNHFRIMVIANAPN